MQLRRHQRELAEICEEMLGGRGLKEIVCADTPGKNDWIDCGNRSKRMCVRTSSHAGWHMAR